MTKSAISERAERVLTLLVQRYIEQGRPVSSKSLSQDVTVALSSATIRNVLSELEDLGYLHAPHTSAGRIPTAMGYRLFVDGLLTSQALSQPVIDEFKERLNPSFPSSSLVQSASHLLSQLTSLAGLVTLPKRERAILRHVEFLPLSNGRVLVILVINEQEVQNRILQTKQSYSASELEQAANYINEHFCGMPLQKIRERLLQSMHDDKQSLNQVLQTIVDVADGAFSDEQQNDYVLAGQHNLLEMAKEADLNEVQRLFDAFVQKRQILYLFDQCLEAEGIQIFIGEESGHDAFEHCSVITAPYSHADEVIGVLGVIGPTRMYYDRVIPIVDVTAKILSAALAGNDDY